MRFRLWVSSAFWMLAALGWSFEARATQDPSPRIVAVGDVHGSPGAFSRLLRAATLVDEAGAWIGGKAVLVQTGDLTDRGPGVREVLDLMRELEQSAQANGGRVVSLLGNHEIYNLIGYYDYQSTPAPVFAAIAASFSDRESEKTRKKAYKMWASWARRYPPCADARKDAWMARNPLGFIEYQEALSPRGEYGQWLRNKQVVAKVGDVLFLHGGLSPELAEMGIESLESINTRAAAELDQFDLDRKWLDQNRVIPRYPTLAELHCAVSVELLRTKEEAGAEAGSRHRALEEMKARLPDLPTWMLLDPRGPVWFRGYASWSDEEAEAGIAEVLEVFGGERVVVGHTPQPGAITARAGGRIFLIDTAMAYPGLSGRAVALEIVGDSVSEIGEAGRRPLGGQLPTRQNGTEPGSRELVDGLAAGHQQGKPATRVKKGATGGSPSSQRTWLGPDGTEFPFTDEEAVLVFLETAKIIDKKTLRKGVTQAQKLLLEKDGLRAHAVFHDINDEKQRYRERGRQFLNFRDSYLNNLAAYELGRLLHFTNIVPTAKRRVGGRMGSIQLWIEKAIDEEERRERGGTDVMSLHMRRRISDMWVFDNLINNADRNQGNMLHDSRGEFWMIDHTRTFNGSRTLPNPERMRRCSSDLLAAIRNLDKNLVRTRLEPYLRSFEVKALLVRREKLLAYLDARIAEKGEDSVLFAYADADDAVTVYYDEDDVPAAPGDG